MNSILNSLKQQFKSGSMVIKLIMANLTFFVVTIVLGILLKLSNSTVDLKEWYYVSSDFFEVLKKPWTLVTYMFGHDLSSFGHLFWNMVMLYFAGNFFVQKIGNKKLLSVYLAGGFFGYVLYAICYNLFPAFTNTGMLVGASAAVSAILVAIGTRFPNFEVKLLFIPQSVKLKYIVGIFVLVNLIRLQASFDLVNGNSGGWISHIGGAIFGFIYGARLKEGKNILMGFERFLDRILSFSFSGLKTKKTSKVKAQKRQTPPKDDYAYNETKANSQKRTDAILDKISKSGYDSLSKKEKAFLFSQSNKK